VNTSARGSQRERAVVKLLRHEGWVAFRAPASLGVADVIAMRAHSVVVKGTFPDWHDFLLAEARLIEVKSTSTRGPYNDFGPEQRRALSEAARQAGAIAYLYHWPLRGTLTVIPESDWPA